MLPVPLSRHRPAAIACAVAAFIGACAPSGEVAVDLVEALDDAEVFVETARIDVGTRRGRHHLLDGWLPSDEMWAHRPEQTFVWAVGDRSRFRFFVFEQRDLVMQIIGRPSPSQGDPEVAAMLVQVNGQPVGREDVEMGWLEYRTVVPRQLLQPGQNVVELSFVATGDSPAAPPRHLAVDEILFQRTVVTYPPRKERGGPVPALVMPYLSGAWYELELEEGARLLIDLARAYGPHKGDPEGHVEVQVEASGEISRHSLFLGEASSVPLPAGEVRLGLMAIPGGEPNRRADRRHNEEAVGILLQQPVVLEPGS